MKKLNKIKKTAKKAIKKTLPVLMGAQGGDAKAKRSRPSYRVLLVDGYKDCEAEKRLYRVASQHEQLSAAGLKVVNSIHYLDASAPFEFDADAVLLLRCPMTEGLGALIEAAHSNGKPVVYDAYDLAISPEYLSEVIATRGVPSYLEGRIEMELSEYAEALSQCDALICSTPELAEKLGGSANAVYANGDYATKGMVELASKLFVMPRVVLNDTVSMGYFCGSTDSPEQLGQICDAIASAFKVRPHLQLHCIDDCEIPETLVPYKDRIVFHERPKKWIDVLYLLHEVDFALAPSMDLASGNIRPADRWLEASLVSVPTISSATPAYRSIIDEGVTGFLCNDAGEWVAAINALADSSSLRHRVGVAARKKCLNSHTASVNFANLDRVLDPNPKSIEEVLPNDSEAKQALVVNFLASRGIVPGSIELDMKPWNEVSVESRVSRVLTSVAQGKKVAALLYDRKCGDDATFRYYGYNVSERLVGNDAWDAVYFFLDEADELKRIADSINILMMIRMRIRPELIDLVGSVRNAGARIAYMIDDNALGKDSAARVVMAMAKNVKDIRENEFWYGTAERFLQASLMADCLIATSPYFADLLKNKYDKPAFVIRPSVNDAQMAVANKVLECRGEGSDDHFYIGFFSGTESHAADFALVENVLFKFLDQHQEAKLLLVGAMKLTDRIVKYWRNDRVVLLPRVDFVTLQYLQSAVDAIIAPLPIDEFNNCKSGLKVFEAGAVGTPACASPTPSYKEAIEDGKTGFVCEKESDWENAFEALLRYRGDDGLRTAARELAVERYYGDAVESMIVEAFEGAVKSNEAYETPVIPEAIGRCPSISIDWDDPFQASIAYGIDIIERAPLQKSKRSNLITKQIDNAYDALGKTRREGFQPAYDLVQDRIRDYLNERREKRENPDKTTFVDVLFVNGCALSLPHPIRYRVDHQIEQLRSAGLTAKRINAWNLKLADVARARSFVIYRCPYTARVGKFIELAKQLNKKVYYDIDDLVIDRRYTDTIEFLQTMCPGERAGYDEGVDLMGRTLRECGAAITTTERLATELKKFVPGVFINRNTASETMLAASNRAYKERFELAPLREDAVPPNELAHYRYAQRTFGQKLSDEVTIGYFSGSITHNDDFQMILPALVDVMNERPKTKLMVMGALDLPEELESFKDRIIAEPFCHWRRLPDMIVKVDINIVPLVDTVFNEAKSENKWVEAALVKIPTVASNVGAFATMIEDSVTGLLCDSLDDWRAALLDLIDNESKRRSIAEAAHDRCVTTCLTTSTGHKLAHYLEGEFTENVHIVLPSLATSGGVLVALEHCAILQRAGYDVTVVDNSSYRGPRLIKHSGCVLPVISGRSKRNKDSKPLIEGSVDTMVATFWETTRILDISPHVKEKKYLVQNYETDFYEAPNPNRKKANATYNRNDLDYITISRWCQDWLEERELRRVRYAPNGIDPEMFPWHERSFDPAKKVRVLIEGDPKMYYKNVDESFAVTNLLDPDRFEIWFMSYNGKPKPEYRVDRFLHKVPHEDVGNVYAACDILLKTSILESFSYPPLEMMATGGFVVAIPNDGNTEYLEHGKNCLLFDSGDTAGAVASIEAIAADEEIRSVLMSNMEATVREHRWDSIASDVLALYHDCKR